MSMTSGETSRTTLLNAHYNTDPQNNEQIKSLFFGRLTFHFQSGCYAAVAN